MRTHIGDSAVVCPWDISPEVGTTLTSEGDRCVLVTSGDVQRVVLSVSGESLPLLATFADHRRMVWRKFELPAADHVGRAPIAENIVLKLFTEADYPVTLRVNLCNALARPMGREEAESGETLEDYATAIEGTRLPWSEAAEAADGLIHRQLELINRLYDSVDVDREMFWDNPGGGVGAWPLRRLVQAWREADFDGDASRRDDEGIVKLSRRLTRLLNDVCHRPRKYLTRKREILPAERVREVDSACVRWLARQPGQGRRMVERVGVKRQAMGVVRYETADTVENRVVRDLIRRAKGECRRVLDRRSMEEGTDDAVATELAVFTEMLSRLERESPLADVQPMNGVPRPNHVIGRDPRYRALWRAYMTLVKRQQQRDRTWRWRRRIWAEACLLGTLAALENIASAASAWRSPMLMRPEEQCGRFIDPRTAVGRWDLPDVGESGATLLWLDGHQLHQYQTPTRLPEQLLRLCPDAALVLRDGRKPDQMPLRIVGIWAVLGFDLEADQLRRRTQELGAALRLVPGATQMRGLLLLPDGFVGRTGTKEASADRVWLDPCLGLRLPMPVQRSEALLEAAIREVVTR
ncbi:MAG: DUF2357 domain-containing protein [Phycisphaeraceae bacterium]